MPLSPSDRDTLAATVPLFSAPSDGSAATPSPGDWLAHLELVVSQLVGDNSAALVEGAYLRLDTSAVATLGHFLNTAGAADWPAFKAAFLASFSATHGLPVAVLEASLRSVKHGTHSVQAYLQTFLSKVAVIPAGSAHSYRQDFFNGLSDEAKNDILRNGVDLATATIVDILRAARTWELKKNLGILAAPGWWCVCMA